MEFNIDQSVFLQMLQTVSYAVPNKPIIAALAGIFVDVSEGKVKLTANNLEISISISNEAEVIEPGQALIPAKILTEAVRRSPGETVTIKQANNSSVHLRSGAVQMEILCLPTEEFPDSPIFAFQHSYALPQPLFKDMLGQTSFAISREELRPVLTGALLSIDRENTKLTALDGFKLACRWTSYLKTDKAMQAVLPAKAVQDLLRLLGEDGQLQLGIGENYAAFSFGEVRLVTRLLEGKFPDIGQFIPDKYQTKIVVSTDDLWQAMERAALVAQAGQGGSVKLNISDGKIAVSAQSMKLGKHYEEIAIEMDGEDLEIMYNISSFIQILRSAQAAQVNIDFHGAYGPCICRPVGQEDYFSLLMPVRLT